VNIRVAVAAIGGALVTSLVLWLWARRSVRRDQGEVPLAELARRYRAWEIAGVAILLGSIGLSWIALLWLARVYPAADPDVAYRLTAHPLYWAAVAFFVGNLAATGPTHLLYARLMGERFPEFRDYQTRKFGFDSWRWMAPFYLVFGTACIAAIVYLLDWYLLIGSQGIIVNDFPRFAARHYTYDRVLQIRTAEQVERKDGTVEQRFAVVFQFDDGRHWSSRRDPANTPTQRMREIAAYVSHQSTLPIVEVSILQRDEL